jgi:transcriptional regulator with XRE-family HTH domain
MGLGIWLRNQMRQRDLTHNELARQSGVPGATLTRIIRYGHVPKTPTLNILADFFGADRPTVLEIAGLVELSDLPSEIPPAARNMIRRIYRLPPSDQRAVLGQIEGLLTLIESIRGTEASAESETQAGAGPENRPDEPGAS